METFAAATLDTLEPIARHVCFIIKLRYSSRNSQLTRVFKDVPQLALGDNWVPGFVYPGAWNYYHASAISQNALHIKVMQDQGG